MDKFGVFKFLNSFLDFYKANPTAFSSSQSNSQPTFQPVQTTQPNSVNAQKNTPVAPPLHDKMLKTARNHEQIVARVMQKNCSEKCKVEQTELPQKN